MTHSLIAVLYAVAATVPTGDQAVDISGLMADIRAAVAAQMPHLSLPKGGEVGPGSTGDLFLTWGDDGKDHLHVSCRQHSSSDEAIRQLRQMRMRISAGLPEPLPGVADEAYYLNAYGWHTYFARRQFVCQAGGRTEGPTRGVTEIVVKQIDSSIRETAK